MPAQWTGDLVGEMHRNGVTKMQLAQEVGWNPKYLSVVLNGHRQPRDAERKLNAALLRLEIKQERSAHGLSPDLHALVERYRAISPDYAAELESIIGLSPASPA